MTSYRSTPRFSLKDRDLDGSDRLVGDPFKDNPWDKERGKPTVEHGFLFDDVPLVINCSARKFRGTAATLRRTQETPARWDKLATPTLAYFEMQSCHKGVSVEGADWTINQLEGSGFREQGLDIWKGNCHVNGGHLYGGRWLVQVRSGAWSFLTDLQMNDSEVCLLQEAHRSEVTSCFSQRGWKYNFLIGAETLLGHNTIHTYEDSRNMTDWPNPIAVKFANEGPLCANWSSDDHSRIYLSKGCTGYDVNAHMVTLDKCFVDGPLESEAIVIDRANKDSLPPDGLDIDLKICGPRVTIRAIGQGCTIKLRNHVSGLEVKLPSEWPSSSHIFVQGEEKKAA